MKGIFNQKPSLPRYNSIWDVNIVLAYLEKLNNLTLLGLSEKLCMLFLLITAQRCQTLHLVEIEDIEFYETSCVIRTNHLLKQSKPGHHLADIVLNSYQKSALCIVKTLQEYIKRTSVFRDKVKRLLISTQKPHQGVSQATVSRWVKSIMLKAGINKQFGAHSTRAAATSAARLKGVPLLSIVKKAGWSNARMFEKFYHKSVPEQRQGPSFQTAIQCVQ